MHISLDSALGRQRRLNSVGESVLQIAPDAAAAYSLRSLTGGDPDVVRVRRESDNTEKDFSGSQIESGEMARWVNEQPTLPLDLRELDTNTGERDGALIEAAAAYSLRKLKEDFTGDVVEVRRNVDGETEGFTADEVTDGTLEGFVNASFDDELPLDQATGASAAYSLRNLSSSYTGDVVEVRRSSDDTVQSFTAAEVADGTLTDWVSEDVTIYQSDFSSGVDGWSQGGVTTLSGNQDGVSDGATSKDNVLKLTKNQDSQAYTSRDQGVIAGLTYTVSGSFYAPSSNTAVDGILIKDGIVGGSLSNYPSGYLTSSGVWTDFSFSYTATVSGSQRINMGISSLGSSPNGSSAGSTGDVVYISDLQFVETTSNGHVKTWYDQSGSDNHATQTDAAKQPKIVESGNLVTRNGDAAIKSTSDNEMTFTLDSLSADGQQSVFAVLENDVTSQDGFGGVFRAVSTSTSTGGVNRRPWWFVNPAGYLAFTVDSLSGYQNSDREYLLYSHIMNNDAGGTSTVHKDGTQVDTRSITLDANATFSSGKVLGVTTNATGALYMSEVIYYPSDQSDKRRAIEENIANHYDITLPAFSRDGTVSTWYDQSGNTNHAVQTTVAEQPKIVNAGVLVSGGIKFDAGADTLDLPDVISSINSASSFTVARTTNASATQSALALSRNDPQLARFYAPIATSGNFYFGYGANTTAVNLGSSDTSEHLFTGIAGSSTAEGFIDGTSGGTVSSVDLYSQQNSGGIGSINGTTQWVGTIQEIIIYDTDQSDNRTALEANIGETYGITGIPAANDTVNGFVQTWYDQSGEANDAVQTTAANQPKIVGEVTSGQPHAFLGAIEFDGLDDFLDLTTDLTSQPYSTFSVYSATQNTSYIYSGGTLPATGRRSTGAYIMHHGAVLTGGTHPDAEILGTYLANGVSSEIFSNGTSVVSGNAGNTSDTIQYVFGRPANAFGGTAKELIIYNSDQSSNRPAIETNIANQYGITLS